MAITNVSVFRSTDTGAISGVNGRCSGTVGDGIALLNQLLLNGYNWQELSAANLTQVGNVATVAQTAHGFNIDQRLWLVGADQSGYVSDAIYPTAITNSNSFTYTCTGNPTSPASASGNTTLNGGITSSATSITVLNAASFPSSGQFAVKVETEYMLVTAGQGTNTWTVVRGFARSTAASHLTAVNVTQVILIGVAPAGGYNHWTADYTGTNLSTYRPPAGNRFWLDVDDTYTTYCRLRGYESMTAAGVGTGPFPHPVLQVVPGTTNAFNWLRSDTANTTAHPWEAIASDRFLYLFTHTNVGSQPYYNSGIWFADLIDQTKTGDQYATLLVAGTYSNGNGGGEATYNGVNLNGVIVNHYLARSYTQAGIGVNASKQPLDSRFSAANQALGSSGLTYPHPPDGGLYISKILVSEGSQSITRGTLPGLWAPLHNRPISHMDVWYGSGAYAGKKFLSIWLYTGCIFVEISNTIQAT